MTPFVVMAFVLTATSVTPPDPGATVAKLHGKPVLRRDAPDGSRLLGVVLHRLLEDYATSRKIDASAAELTEYLRLREERKSTEEARYQREIEKARADLANARNDYQKKMAEENLASLQKSHAELEKLKPFMEKYRLTEAQERESARETIRGYKIAQALWAEYGGRVAFQQFGPEPIDAFKALLQEHEKKGTFAIVDKSMEKAFWHYLSDEMNHMLIEGPDAQKLMSTPWWLAPPED